jgi:tetratricopeptide (TPR) repeat protein
VKSKIQNKVKSGEQHKNHPKRSQFQENPLVTANMFRQTNTVSKASGGWIPQTPKSTNVADLPPLSPHRAKGSNGSKLVSPEHVTKETKQKPSQAAHSLQAADSAYLRESQVHGNRPRTSKMYDTMHIVNAALHKSMLERPMRHFEVGLALTEIGGIHLDRGDNRKAYQVYKRAITCNQGCTCANDTLHIPLAHEGIGVLHFIKGNTTGAIKRIQLASQQIEKSELLYGQTRQTIIATSRMRAFLGRVLMHNNDYDGAMHALTEALEAQQRMLGPESNLLAGTRNTIAELQQQYAAISTEVSGDTVIHSQIAAPVYSGKASLTLQSHPDDKGLTTEMKTFGYVSLKSISEVGSHLSNADDDASYDSMDGCLCSGPLDSAAQLLRSIVSWAGE